MAVIYYATTFDALPGILESREIVPRGRTGVVCFTEIPESGPVVIAIETTKLPRPVTPVEYTVEWASRFEEHMRHIVGRDVQENLTNAGDADVKTILQEAALVAFVSRSHLKDWVSCYPGMPVSLGDAVVRVGVFEGHHVDAVSMLMGESVDVVKMRLPEGMTSTDIPMSHGMIKSVPVDVSKKTDRLNRLLPKHRAFVLAVAKVRKLKNIPEQIDQEQAGTIIEALVHCPKCESASIAYGPKPGVKWRGSAKCQACNEMFSAVGQRSHLYKLLKAETLILEAITGTYYHGSQYKFDRFDIAKIGMGHDQEGPGLYFSDNKDDAFRYAPRNGYEYTVELNMRKVVPIKGRVSAAILERVIRMNPNWRDNAINWDEDPVTGVRQAAQQYAAYSPNPHAAFQSVWYDFYRREPGLYLKNMVALGYDGVEVPRREGVKHVVVYNPDAIKIVSVHQKGVTTNAY